ncbi:MAG: cyclic nucleotide-binding domain-containing protein [Candidatus Hydrogenedentes bacterium]|nr:cyclic nucleotide-binding domain-containing protein [Candidatus Hydrogenedentota bacterium]
MDEMELCKRFARRIRIFQGLEPSEISDILRRGKLFRFEAGQIIFHEGTLGTSIFIVLDGEVRIYSKSTFIGKCRAGDAFGEMAVLNHRPRMASATAHTTSMVFTLAESELNQILEKRVAVRILLNIIHVLSERLENANLHIAEHRLVRVE